MTQYPQDPQNPQDQPPPPPPSWQPGWGDTGAVPAPGMPGGGAPYAEWIKRVGGYLVDVALLIPAYILIFVGAGVASSGGVGETSGAGFFFAVLGYVALIGVAVWNMVLRQGRTGWSVGKQVVGIRLIAEKTGEPLGAGLTFVRLIAHTLDSLACYIGWLWPLWDKKRQTFADKIMGTVVIEQKKL